MSVVRKGMEGAAEIQRMMVDYRADPPREIAGSPVVKINDFKLLESTDVRTGAKTPIEEEASNVLRAELESVADFDRVEAGLDAKIETIKKELKLV